MRVRISSFPVTASLTEFILGAEQRFDSPKFGDVDSQERREMKAVLFRHQEPIAGMVMAVVGHEIDSDKAYEEQIDTFSEAFQDYLKDALVFAVGGIGGAVLKFGLKHPLAVAIAIAIAVGCHHFPGAVGACGPDHRRRDRAHHRRVGGADERQLPVARLLQAHDPKRSRGKRQPARKGSYPVQGISRVRQRRRGKPVHDLLSLQPGGVGAARITAPTFMVSPSLCSALSIPGGEPCRFLIIRPFWACL